MTRLQARTQIENQLKVNGPFSHNMIGIVLSGVAKRYGIAEANRMIEKMGLDKLGWRPLPYRPNYRKPRTK